MTWGLARVAAYRSRCATDLLPCNCPGMLPCCEDRTPPGAVRGFPLVLSVVSETLVAQQLAARSVGLEETLGAFKEYLCM